MLLLSKHGLPADKIVIRAGEELNTSMILLEGWMARSKDLQSGRAAGDRATCCGRLCRPARIHAETARPRRTDAQRMHGCDRAARPPAGHHRALSAPRRVPIGSPPMSTRPSIAKWPFRSASAQRCRAWLTCFASFTSASRSSAVRTATASTSAYAAGAFRVPWPDRRPRQPDSAGTAAAEACGVREGKADGSSTDAVSRVSRSSIRPTSTSASEAL